MRKRQYGLAPLIALIILAIIAVVVSAGAYYLLKGTGRYPSETSKTRRLDYGQPTQVPSSEEVPISDSDKTSDIESELNSTNIGDLESDIQGLELDAESL